MKCQDLANITQMKRLLDLADLQLELALLKEILSVVVLNLFNRAQDSTILSMLQMPCTVVEAPKWETKSANS